MTRIWTHRVCRTAAAALLLAVAACNNVSAPEAALIGRWVGVVAEPSPLEPDLTRIEYRLYLGPRGEFTMTGLTYSQSGRAGDGLKRWGEMAGTWEVDKGMLVLHRTDVTGWIHEYGWREAEFQGSAAYVKYHLVMEGDRMTLREPVPDNVRGWYPTVLYERVAAFPQLPPRP
jgi:hypothetical protein